MAFYIDIRKTLEDDNFAEYQFSSSPQNDKNGLLRINKNTGKIVFLKSVANDPKGNISQRAAVKLFKHWHHGDLPESTCWAS